MMWNGGPDDAKRKGDSPHLCEAPFGPFRRAPSEAWSGTVPFFRKKPVVTVVHSLPGRVRGALLVAPGDVPRMLAGVREHPGMESISYSPITKSILARFNPHEISQEEIVLRIAFHLSLDCDSAPVRLLAEG